MHDRPRTLLVVTNCCCHVATVHTKLLQVSIFACLCVRDSRESERVLSEWHKQHSHSTVVFTCTCPQYLQMACCKHSICMSMHKHKFGDGSYVPHADYLRLVGSRGQAKPGQKRKRNNSAQSTHPLNATYTTRGRYGVPTSPSNSNSAFGTVFLAPNAAATRPQRTRNVP